MSVMFLPLRLIPVPVQCVVSDYRAGIILCPRQ